MLQQLVVGGVLVDWPGDDRGEKWEEHPKEPMTWFHYSGIEHNERVDALFSKASYFRWWALRFCGRRIMEELYILLEASKERYESESVDDEVALVRYCWKAGVA